MRFGLPKSNSPSPVRGYRRGNSTFGLHSYSEEDNHDEYNAYKSDSDSSISSALSSSSGSPSSLSPQLDYGGRSKTFDGLGSPPRQAGTTTASRAMPDTHPRDPERQTEDTLAIIRLWTRHRDPYEEWEKKTRKEALRSARKQLSSRQTTLQMAQTRLSLVQDETRETSHAKQVTEIEYQLSRFRLAQEKEESLLREKWKAREKMLWDRIESVIKLEEGKIRAQLEAERAKKEAEEKKRDEEMKRKLLQERKEMEENQRKEVEARKRKEEEDEHKKNADEVKRGQEEERLKNERTNGEANARSDLGYQTASEDWVQARENLLAFKDKVLALVKSNKELKSEWNKFRRQITPKIGQITNDEESIKQISTQLFRLLKPISPHRPVVYMALCYSLAKAVVSQAETEVTAEKRSAIPLARVTFNLLSSLEIFSEILWAKLVQRVGGWPIPTIIPDVDVDGRVWGTGEKGKGRGGDKERWRVVGYRTSQGTSSDVETHGEYSMRVSGVMRVYWEIVKVQLRYPNRAPMDGPFQITRYWIWFARILDQRPLLQTAVGAELIFTALEVLGIEAADIWGHQWIKILQLIHEGITVGIYGQDQKLLGGDTAEGKAAKARVQMEVERIVSGEKPS